MKMEIINDGDTFRFNIFTSTVDYTIVILPYNVHADRFRKPDRNFDNPVTYRVDSCYRIGIHGFFNTKEEAYAFALNAFNNKCASLEKITLDT